MKYYSENWYEATEKLYQRAAQFNSVRRVGGGESAFEIPYVEIGSGNKKIIINSGVHGLEGFFGSAAQLSFLDRVAGGLMPKFLQEYTIVLIHVINGWGMQHRMREVSGPNGELVDLNRNFGVDFSRPEALPQNTKYLQAHDLLLSKPDDVVKKNALKEFRAMHLNDGVWDSISYGQYTHPFGLFYGGDRAARENDLTLAIYDDVMRDASELISVGLHTGLGRFDKKRGVATAGLLVSHPDNHPKTQFFQGCLRGAVPVVADNAAANGPVLLGDLVDCLEARYQPAGANVYSADFEIGTGEYPIMSPIYKRMDMGDARYDLMHGGKINPKTLRHLTESWYPSNTGWRHSALNSAAALFSSLISGLQNSK